MRDMFLFYRALLPGTAEYNDLHACLKVKLKEEELRVEAARVKKIEEERLIREREELLRLEQVIFNILEIVFSCVLIWCSIQIALEEKLKEEENKRINVYVAFSSVRFYGYIYSISISWLSE